MVAATAPLRTPSSISEALPAFRRRAAQVLAVALPVVEEVSSLPEPFHREPVDRILVATARTLRCSLVTADATILASPHVDAVW